MSDKKQVLQKVNGRAARRDIVLFLREYTREHGFPPSRREIMAGAGISSTSMVNFHLTVLRNLGAITWEPDLSRAIRVSSNAEKIVEGSDE